MTTLNTSELKERERNNWTSAAEGWRRRDALLRKGAAPVTARMLELSGIHRGSQILDIASGTGEPAISAAQIAGDNGRVVGTDLVDEMLEVARDKATTAQLTNITFHCIDAETLDFTPESFDAVTIRWGLMFMPDPLACLTAARKALKPEGRISLACWAAIDKNPFVGVLIKLLNDYMNVPVPPAGTPGIFSFAEPERLRDVLTAAGFTNITLEEMVIDVIEVADGRAYWETISDLAAPVMALVNQLSESARKNYIAEVIKYTDAMKQGESLRMKGTTWIASADK